MPGKAGEKVVRVLVPEIVEQEKRIELRRVAEPEGALEPDAGAFDRWLGLADVLHRAD
jgi:hypothetical protein